MQDQFIEEFHKWGKINYLDRVEILCYQSAYKLQNQHYDIVVCDEIHLGLSPEYRKFFDNNTYDSLICMTATLPEEPEYRKILSDLNGDTIVETATITRFIMKTDKLLEDIDDKKNTSI